MDTPLPSHPSPENDQIWAAFEKFKQLYAKTPGGHHARLVKFQNDMFGLCELGYLVPVRAPKQIQYHLAGRVPVSQQSLVLSLDELRTLHLEQLRVSAARWN